MSVMTSREFNHDVGAAKRAALQEPVVITDRGEPAFVLLSIEEYRRVTGQRRSLVDLIWVGDEIEFEPPRMELASKVPQL